MSRVVMHVIGVSILVLGLNGCGGSSCEDCGDPMTKPTATGNLSGTAAAGAPLAGKVTVKDSLGEVKSVNLTTNGAYSIDVTGMTPPFVLRAEGTVGGRSYTLHSAATTADVNGTINITPFTDLIIGNIARQVASNYFDAGNVSGLTSAQLDTAENELQQRLQGVLTDLGVSASIDLLRTSFSANHDGVDAALDVLRITVDKASNTATIVNVLNNAAITDDLTTNDTSIIDSTGTKTYANDWEAILARFASFEATFATGLPAATDPLLRAQFDQAGFLDWGQDLASFLADITTDPGLVGFKFASIALVKLTPATAMNNGRAVVNLGLGDAKYGYEYFDMDLTGIYNASTGATNWLIAGNQYIADVGGEMRSTLGFNPNSPAQIQSGIDFYSDIGAAGSAIDYAVITGPGLPTTGGGANGTSAGLLLVGNANINLFVASSPYIGPSTPPHARAQYQPTMYPWTDTEIAALPSDNLTYTHTYYSDNGTPANFNDDVKLAEYQFNLLKSPLPAGSLNVANFPVITGPSKDVMINVGSVGGPITLTWNLPAGLAAKYVDGVRVYSNGSFEGVDDDLSPTATSATLQVPVPGGTVVGGFFGTTASDYYGRNYSYRLYMQ